MQPLAIDELPGNGKKGNNAITARMAEFDDMISKCAMGQAYALPVEDGDTSRGLALRISRACGRLGLIATVLSGTSEGVSVVGFRVDRKMTPAELAKREIARETAKANKA